MELILEVDNQHNLRDKLKFIEANVPPPSLRTHRDREIFNIRDLIASFENEKAFQYPFNLFKRESPDFLVDSSAGKIGIEVTEACDGDNKDHLKAIDLGTQKSQMMSGYPAPGNQFEREFSEILIQRISAKTVALSSKYELFDNNWLLIYNNMPFYTPILHVTLEILDSFLSLYWQNDSTFDRIIIDTRISSFTDFSHIPGSKNLPSSGYLELQPSPGKGYSARLVHKIERQA